MSSRLLGLADAAVAALNAAPAGTFGLEFTTQRRLLPFVDLKLIGTKLLVYVVGVGRIDVRQGNVASFNGEYDLALLVQQRFQPTDDVEAKGEALVNLAEQLCGYLGTVRLTVGTGSGLLKLVHGHPAYNLKALEGMRLFDSAQILTFKVIW